MGVVFLLQLACGCAIFATVCRSEHVAASYLRLMTWVGMGVLAAAIIGELLAGESVWSLHRPTPAILAAMVLLLLAMPYVQVADRRPRVIGGMAVAVIVLALWQTTRGWPQPWTALPALVLGAMLIGGTSATMLLGHAYLTQTQMPIDPLMRLTRLLIGTVIVMWCWAGVVLWRGHLTWQMRGTDETWLWLMLSIRVGVGLVGLSVLIYMIHDCVRRRSTQSATGILYIAMIFAFLGQLTAMELGKRFGLWV